MLVFSTNSVEEYILHYLWQISKKIIKQFEIRRDDGWHIIGIFGYSRYYNIHVIFQL